MMTLNALDQTNDQMQTSIQRLSTGLRINTGADDPAGLIISENLKAQVQGISQAINNAQDGVNMSKTADAAMSEISQLLINLRGLAVQAANSAVVDSTQLQADQTQVQSTIQSINRIASQTQFGEKNLLDGTAGVLANVTDSADVSSLYVGSNFGGGSVQNGAITVQRTAAATEAQVNLGGTFTSANSVLTTPGSVVVNGYTFTISGSDTLQTLVNQMNQMSSTTGVTAQIVGSAGSYSVQLNQNTFGSQYAISFFDPNKVLGSSTAYSSTGSDAVAKVTMATSVGPQTVTFTGGIGSGTSGLVLQDNQGNKIVLTGTGNAGLTTNTAVGQVTSGQIQFQIGAFAGQTVDYSMPTMFAADLGTSAVNGQSIGTLDLTTNGGAQTAMKVIDDAISQVAQVRGQLGAFQSDFLQSSVRSLNVAQDNLTASQSQIADTNMASEITNFTKLQILQNAGMSVLGQANQQPQQVLQLLKNM